MPKYKEMLIAFMWFGYGVCVGVEHLLERSKAYGWSRGW
jgi:hypothetical protein